MNGTLYIPKGDGMDLYFLKIGTQTTLRVFILRDADSFVVLRKLVLVCFHNRHNFFLILKTLPWIFRCAHS